MFFALKIIISGMIIAFASWLAGRRPVLAGFIISLPLLSMLALVFSYAEYHDMEKINRFAVSILIAVPLSLVFFIPFLLNKWLKLNFGTTFILAIFLLVAAYSIHALIFKRI